MVDTTTNFKLLLPVLDKIPWNDDVNDNSHVIDALMARFIAVSNVQGTYQNATAVTIGQRYIDTADDTIFEVLIAHTTPSTGTFAANRVLKPLEWQNVTVSASFVGTWTAARVYAVNEFLTDAGRYGVVTVAHIAVTSYDTGVTAGNIETLIDANTIIAATHVATGLAEGAAPTATYAATIFTFGIPVGATGATGATSQSVADEIRRRTGSTQFQANTNRHRIEETLANLVVLQSFA